MTRTAAVIAALSTLALAMTLLVTPALATHVDPELFQGNQTCSEATGGAYPYEFKVGPVSAGVKDDPASEFEVEITLNSTADGQTFDFEANMPVNAVFVKGGNGGNLYDYGVAGETSDDGLHAPGNDAGTAVATPPWAGLSHISFCFGDVPDETPTPTPTPTASPTPEESEAGETATPTPTPTPEQSVEGATGTPAPSLPDGAMGFSGGTSQIPTVIFAMILLASLGTLAWANVRTVRNRS
jgi:hypothetical protein